MSSCFQDMSMLGGPGERLHVERGIGVKKLTSILRRVRRCWCNLWQLRWEDMNCIDHHRWETRMEIRRRLSMPRRGYPTR